MELSVREAATLLGASPRTVRARLVRGDLPGVKRNGRWRIERRDLPLSAAQREAFQGKADRIRRLVEESLPPRLARTAGQRGRSLADLDAFRLGAELLVEMRGATPDAISDRVRARVERTLEQALLSLAEAVQQFDRELKARAVERSRAAFARAGALLLLAAGIPPPEPALGWVVRLEGEVLPAVAGFARWVAGLSERRR